MSGGNYGYLNDNQLWDVSIPLSAFTNLDLVKIDSPFGVVMDSASGYTTGTTFVIGEIILTKY